MTAVLHEFVGKHIVWVSQLSFVHKLDVYISSQPFKHLSPLQDFLNLHFQRQEKKRNINDHYVCIGMKARETNYNMIYV